MPGNKKPKKARPRARPSREALAHTNPVFAATKRHALGDKSLRSVALQARVALQSVLTGTQDDEDCQGLATVSNVAMVLCEMGHGEEYLEDAKAGQAAIVRAGVLACASGIYRAADFKLATQQDVATVTSLVELFEQQAAAITAADMGKALRTVKERIDKGQTTKITAPGG